ncbi:MAG: MmcQ/YjbR family DNA-binding protein [Acidimicrobiia bacterium]|nr:MmcQ/YjbR family DNA-binding protein [Acidimicrobiia bacterium]
MAHFDNPLQLLDSFAGATSGYPFGPGALVYKVGGKMFALVADDVEPFRISLKCEPDLALELRALYPGAVSAGYHLNKRHWNTIEMNDTLPKAELEEWISHSYDLVVAGLPRRQRETLR